MFFSSTFIFSKYWDSWYLLLNNDSQNYFRKYSVKSFMKGRCKDDYKLKSRRSDSNLSDLSLSQNRPLSD